MRKLQSVDRELVCAVIMGFVENTNNEEHHLPYLLNFLSLILTMSELLLFGQHQHIHVAMCLQGSCEDSALAAEQEYQWQGNVLSGVAISNHLEEGSFLAVTSLAVV